MKIFLVDDEPFALRVMEHQLQQLDHHAVRAFQRAADAVTALEADAAAADIILLDLQMPDMDGIEFTRHLARLGFAGGIVLISGEDERILHTASTLAKAHALRLLDALHKPVPLEALRAILDAPTVSQPPARGPRKSYASEAIRDAIAQGHLVNHYQPKVDLRTARVSGVETLVRWQHPVDGLVFPDQFIAQAEEHRLIDALTRTVLGSALLTARSWQQAGHDIAVAVNVSMDNLVALDFPDFVEAALRSAQVDPRRLVLEVTESRLMTNTLAALDILTRLRLKHIALSIDDFGTGHSSLAQLRTIPFVELKIDRSFVHEAGRDPAARAIVEASLSMARQLKLTTVAEGVEDHDDWQLMRQLGCDYAQGYFVGRPMPAEVFDRWLADWNTHGHLLVR